MEVKVLSKYHRQDEFLMSLGKKVFIEVMLLKLETDKPEFPQGFKFKWIAFNRDNPNERILFDNHTGKGPHWHENGHQDFLPEYHESMLSNYFTKKSLRSLVSFNKN